MRVNPTISLFLEILGLDLKSHCCPDFTERIMPIMILVRFCYTRSNFNQLGELLFKKL